MASFHAELHLEGTAYRVLHCAFACYQAVSQRGRAQARVRYEPLQLVLDVPEGDALLAWAATPHKPLGGEVVFYHLAQQVASETIVFEAGECVAYAEQFASGDTGNGAYVCHLTIAAPKFELRAGGPLAPASPAGLLAGALPLPVGVPALSAVVPPALGGAAVAAVPAAVPAAAEYTLAEFKSTIWGGNQVDPAVVGQLYQHFNDAKASADPMPYWAAIEQLIRGTTYLNAKGDSETLNGGWPPANGGFNKRLVQPTPPDKFDRYQKQVAVDAAGNPILGGTFTSPVSANGPFAYEARALEGQESDYDLQYEVEILKPLPFAGEEATVIPWHGHQGNGTQTRMLFPPKDATTGLFPWDWQKLQREGYVRVTYKSSPNGKFIISPDGSTAKSNLV